MGSLSDPGMPETYTWHVTPHEEEGWQVKRETADQATSRHDTKKQALEAAKDLARNKPTAHVAVHKRDGTIQQQFTYGEG